MAKPCSTKKPATKKPAKEPMKPSGKPWENKPTKK